jgi:F-type H+-transporting ATPase subunit epsilon
MEKKMAKLNVELVTPEAIAYAADVEMVVVPGMEGDIGVLAGHAPLISSLRPGVIDIYESGAAISKQIFVIEGFAEVTQARCTILARNAIDVTGNPDEAKKLIHENSGK